MIISVAEIFPASAYNLDSAALLIHLRRKLAHSTQGTQPDNIEAIEYVWMSINRRGKFVSARQVNATHVKIQVEWSLP